MKILFLGMGWFEEQKGGLNRYLVDMIDSIESKISDYRVIYYAEKSYNVKHKNFYGSSFEKILRVRSVTKNTLKEFTPDIVNIHFAFYAFFIMDLLAKYKIVMNFQGPWASEGLIEKASLKGKIIYLLKKNIEKFVYKRCDKFIVLSNEFKSILINDYKIKEEKIEILPPTLDIKKFNNCQSKNQLRKKYQIENDKFIIFTARRLVKRTGVDLLIEAFNEVLEKNSLLLIAGRGHYEIALKELVKKYNLEERVKFLGFISDQSLPEYYALSDVTVMPTVALEGFGLTTIESFACGTPVVGTPSSANKEVIGKISNTLLSENIDSKTLAKLLNNVITKTSILPTSSECREYVVKNYAPEIFASNIMKLFKDTIL